MTCSPFNPVNETWGQEITFLPLSFTAMPIDDLNTPADERLLLADTTLPGGITLQTGFARLTQNMADTSRVAVSIKNFNQPSAIFVSPSAQQSQRLYAATFLRGGDRIVAVRQDLIDGTPPNIFQRRIRYQLLVVGQNSLPTNVGKFFDLQALDANADVMFAPSPSGRLVFMWRGSAPGTTVEHTLWRTDTGATIAAWAGSVDGGTPLQPRPFRMCRITTQSRSIEFFKSSANNNITSADPIITFSFPAASISLSTTSLTISSSAPAGGGNPIPVTATIDIRNTGNDDVMITGLSLPGQQFGFVQPPIVPFCLEAGGVRALVIRFSPAGNTGASSTLTVTASNGQVVTALIQGAVVIPPPPQAKIRVTPNPLVFPKLSPPPNIPLKITNTGGLPVTLTINAGSKSGFSWPQLGPKPLNPNSTPEILVVSFSPTSTSRVLESLIVDAPPASPETVWLIGNEDKILPGELKILYINANPPGDDVLGEVVWIGNMSSRTIDLNGCSLTDEVFNAQGTRLRTRTFYRFDKTLELPPLTASFSVCRVFTGGNKSMDKSLYRYAGNNMPIWNNSGDTGRIVNPQGTVIDEAKYSRGQFYTIFGPQPVTPSGRPSDPSDPRSPRVIVDITIPVPESASWIDTGIDIQEGDRIDFFASGEIWAGVLFTGGNGPEGWVGWVQTGSNWPYNNAPDAFSFCLIGQLGANIFRIGRRLTHIALGDTTQRLYVGINDDVPGNGSGEFSCRIVVRRS